MSPDESPAQPRPRKLYLFLPWIIIPIVWAGIGSGVPNWLRTTLPYGLGQLALRNIGLGMLLLVIGSSALWAYQHQRCRRKTGAHLIAGTIAIAFAVSVAQFCLAAAIGFAGCVIMMGG